MIVPQSSGIRPTMRQAADTQRTLGSRGGWLLIALLTGTSSGGGLRTVTGGRAPFINAVSDVSVFPYSLWTDNRSLPSLSGTVRRDLCSPAQQSWRGVEGTKTAEIYTL